MVYRQLHNIDLNEVRVSGSLERKWEVLTKIDETQSSEAGVFCEFCEISKNTFFYRKLPVAAFVSQKHLYGSLFFVMFRLQPFNFIKKRPRQKFLPINFKIFQVTFLVEESDRLLVRLVFYLSPYHFSSLSIFWVNRKTLPDTDLSFILFFNKVINEWDSYSNDSQRCRNKNRGVLQKKAVLKHFAKFTGKHLCRSLFFSFL